MDLKKELLNLGCDAVGLRPKGASDARLHADLERDGFVVFRGVFSPAEIADLRRRFAEASSRAEREGQLARSSSLPVRYLKFDALSCRELREVDYLVLDERVLRCVRSLLGDDVAYFSDSSIQIGTGVRGFHKDCAHREDRNGSDWQTSYDVIRMGLYLQEHEQSSGGLKLKPGSHRFVSSLWGRSINVDTRAGDLVFWKLTTSHSGNAVRLRAFPKASLHPRIESMVPATLRVPEPEERMALFCSFGKPGVHLDTYVNYLAGREDFCEYFRNSYHPQTALSLARARGLELRVPCAEFASRVGSAA
ncbi:MAG: phytanoyl-CoA dioxygenase family protein [Myxococcales bacterium]